MEIEIISERNNPFFNRKEVHFIIHHENEGTPNRELVRTELAEKLNAEKEAVIVQRIYPLFGVHQSKGYAKIYTSRRKAEEIEQEYIIKRNPAETKEEKKEEEKKEETVEEEKTEEASEATSEEKE